MVGFGGSRKESRVSSKGKQGFRVVRFALHCGIMLPCFSLSVYLSPSKL